VLYTHTEDYRNQMTTGIMFAKDGWKQAGGKDMNERGKGKDRMQARLDQ
jgi:hypothetical protein